MNRLHRGSLTLATLALLTAAPLTAQSADAEKPAVLAVVTRLFDGMRAGDSAMVRSVFHPRASLTTAVVRQGTPAVEFEGIEGFITAVGTPHAEVWDERIKNPQVLIDGSFASVWVEYGFYLGGKFSHCGIDAFQLAKVGTDWKIVALGDTRRRQGCAPEWS
ncbi:MAG: nuclear transport factor 2 family protein [Gemmatimonadetes bacterium]|nr:nuclear transport factor 2 family protein [Gemmatimonadota bacterium]